MSLHTEYVKNQRVMVQLTAQERRAIEAIAVTDDRSLSYVVRRAVVEFLRRQGEE